MKEYQVLLTPESTQEIRDIHSYIANTLLVPETAKKQISRIMETVGLFSDAISMAAKPKKR